MPKPEPDPLIERMVEQYRRSLQRHLRREPQTIDEIEQVVEDVSVEMDRYLEEAILERKQPPGSQENQLRCPQCSGWARARGVVPRTLITRHGERTLCRRYYYCPGCRTGFAPLDRLLGLSREASTPMVRRLAAQIGAHLPFAEAALLLEQLTGLRLGTSTVERLVVSVGKNLRHAQAEQAERHRAGAGPPVERKPARLYVSVDGIMAPLREAWKKDGSAGKLVCRFAECKTAVVYEARPGPRGDAGVLRRAYVATFEKVEQFGPLVSTLAHRCGVHFAREVVFLADGQAYNWLLAATHFPEATQIVDVMHALEHLHALAQLCLGEGNPAAATWVAHRKEELLSDRIQLVLSAIAALPGSSADQQEARRRERGYFSSNAERMRYGTFRRRGYQIASGVMEAGCKHVVHQRLDQVGMHWRQESAEAVVALRAALLSSNRPDLRPYCAATA
jgi:hypothetical protein